MILLYCSLSFIDLYLSLVFIASIISPFSHFGCCLRLTRCCSKGKCLSIMSKNKDDQLSTISFVSSNILITTQGVEDKSLINSASLKFLKDLYEIEWWDFLSTEDEFSFLVTKTRKWSLSPKIRTFVESTLLKLLQYIWSISVSEWSVILVGDLTICSRPNDSIYSSQVFFILTCSKSRLKSPIK